MPDSETCIRFGIHGACVMIEDEEIPHYATHVDPVKKEVTCWIASEAGKTFSVVWLGLDVKYYSSCDLYLDGHRISSIVRLKSDSEPITIEYGVVSESSCASFMFSPLVVTDDDDYLDSPPSHSIGEIKLVICRTTEPKKMRKRKKSRNTNNLVPPQLQKVHERSKKGIAHRVNYVREIPTPQGKGYYSDELETLMTFIFRYRPLEILRANDIVPRNPEPLEPQENALDTLPTSETSSRKGEHSKVKDEVESGSESDDEDSMREKALLAELEKIRKGRHLKDSKRPKKKLKKEDKPIRVFTPGEIIDLT